MSLQLSPHSPENISTIIQLYRTQLRTYRLTDKFRDFTPNNHQPIPHLDLHTHPRRHQPPRNEKNPPTPGGPTKPEPPPHPAPASQSPHQSLY